MLEPMASQYAVCWINTDERIISFHFVGGYEQSVFPSRQEMIDFCYRAINGGYRIQ